MPKVQIGEKQKWGRGGGLLKTMSTLLALDSLLVLLETNNKEKIARSRRFVPAFDAVTLSDSDFLLSLPFTLLHLLFSWHSIYINFSSKTKLLKKGPCKNSRVVEKTFTSPA